jgi:hypothetical protein
MRIRLTAVIVIVVMIVMIDAMSVMIVMVMCLHVWRLRTGVCVIIIINIR